ncbi:MAG: class I SAM-dependent methyltransferase [Alphaproteobacteria bacterium]|jgi:sarcosine/dimethylglycine N-methyltransferase|nr:class I SAM-dependent methyltransferase [Alphaproteobacteria bacterium]MBT7943350.1 class I SAM-dependent methyltransferase [Alphaproteobacteria bacterium]
MSTEAKIDAHWGKGGLAEAILAALESAGLDPDNLAPGDLVPMEHLHGRGAEATRELLAILSPGPDTHLLDIGSGIGGPARMAASQYGARVTGVDLTQEFCDVAEMLCERVGLGDLITIRQGNALDLPFEDMSFDGAYSQNVSMNIEDKEAFYAEAFRVLRLGGLFVAAEYAEGPGGAPVFPVPWALGPEDNHLFKPDAIRGAVEAVGFEIVDFTIQSEAMIEFYARAREKIAAEGPPALSPQVLLGDDGPERMKNSARSVEEYRAVPVQVVGRRV